MAQRQFDTGATRDSDTNKLDYEGFESPLVTKRFAEYMHKNRLQPDGSLRGSDNWQKGIPKEAYVKSLVRHVEDLKLHWDGFAEEAVDPDFEVVCCAIKFNVQGLLFELLQDKRTQALDDEWLNELGETQDEVDARLGDDAYLNEIVETTDQALIRLRQYSEDLIEALDDDPAREAFGKFAAGVR
jgi:hypothetical protein